MASALARATMDSACRRHTTPTTNAVACVAEAKRGEKDGSAGNPKTCWSSESVSSILDALSRGT